MPQVNEEKTGSNHLLPENTMSVQADQIMEEQFPNENGIPLLLVWHHDNQLTDEDYQLVQRIYQELKENPLAHQSMVPPFAEMPLQALKQSASGDGSALSLQFSLKKIQKQKH